MFLLKTDSNLTKRINFVNLSVFVRNNSIKTLNMSSLLGQLLESYSILAEKTIDLTKQQFGKFLAFSSKNLLG